MQRVRVVDSHTGGEPTRVVLEGFPELLGATVQEKRMEFDRIAGDWWRGLLDEPRGSDPWVGALLLPSSNPVCDFGVIFFNTVGSLHMCGHGTIGLAATLHHLGLVKQDELTLDTPVGPVAVKLHGPNRATLRNVPAYRLAKDVTVEVPGLGTLTGDVAWGGNWFFLTECPGTPLEMPHLSELHSAAWRVRHSLVQQGITGDNGAEIDHIEFFGPPRTRDADGTNYVLCPGGAYDRSPCGTGTSAKVACLVADGKLEPGGTWRQQSITGSVFEARATFTDGDLTPEITGDAFLIAESTLLFDPMDPFCWGVPRA